MKITTNIKKEYKHGNILYKPKRSFGYLLKMMTFGTIISAYLLLYYMWPLPVYDVFDFSKILFFSLLVSACVGLFTYIAFFVYPLRYPVIYEKGISLPVSGKNKIIRKLLFIPYPAITVKSITLDQVILRINGKDQIYDRNSFSYDKKFYRYFYIICTLLHQNPNLEAIQKIPPYPPILNSRVIAFLERTQKFWKSGKINKIDGGYHQLYANVEFNEFVNSVFFVSSVFEEFIKTSELKQDEYMIFGPPKFTQCLMTNYRVVVRIFQNHSKHFTEIPLDTICRFTHYEIILNSNRKISIGKLRDRMDLAAEIYKWYTTQYYSHKSHKA